jgi:hypothetical protein
MDIKKWNHVRCLTLIFSVLTLQIGLTLSLNQINGLTLEDLEKATQVAKGTLDEVEANNKPYQHEPDVLNKRDIYNQTYYDCFNWALAYELALFGQIVPQFHDQSIDECHYFYNETGIWMGLKASENVNFSEPKFAAASEKLAEIRQRD